MRGVHRNPPHMWYPRRDSNAEPTDSKSGALSIELRGRELRVIIAHHELALSKDQSAYFL